MATIVFSRTRDNTEILRYAFGNIGHVRMYSARKQIPTAGDSRSKVTEHRSLVNIVLLWYRQQIHRTTYKGQVSTGYRTSK